MFRSPEMGFGASPEKAPQIIELPDDDKETAKMLSDKAAEYAGRLTGVYISIKSQEDEKKALDIEILNSFMDSWLKASIVGKLLSEKTIEFDKLHNEMFTLMESSEKYKKIIEGFEASGESFEEIFSKHFNNAWVVIKDYVETGGKYVNGGTGFGKPKINRG